MYAILTDFLLASADRRLGSGKTPARTPRTTCSKHQVSLLRWLIFHKDLPDYKVQE